jgi:hypothetical protein
MRNPTFAHTEALRPQLHALTERLLQLPPHHYGELRDTVRELMHWLCGLCEINMEDHIGNDFMLLDNGKAIGPTFAALCLAEMARTQRFAQGLYQAVCDKRAAYPNRPVQVLYAGSGPFATLVLPLAARFGPDEVQWSLLEVNPTTHAMAGQLLRRLGLQEYVRRLELADASTWQVPPDEEIDILVTETMQYALQREPQVPICLHLLPQLLPDAILVPQQIRLTAALVNVGQRLRHRSGQSPADNGLVPFKTVFTFDAPTALQHAAAWQRQPEYRFPSATISFPTDLLLTHPLLYILTEIILYGDTQLLMDECSLTIPLKLADLTGSDVNTLRFQYATGQVPGLVWETV